ncbi:MAG: hypothetical protein JM58_12355 [Peptococcaceae bacterium BICA1-8]|nr:MAG: hypothetical protein JM58_12355 [Peptococcaceae bacterium BICA1-8]
MQNIDYGICLNLNDNVATVLGKVECGKIIFIKGPNNENLGEVTATDEIEIGHKVAIEVIPANSRIIKYGQVIGNSKEHIAKGMWVHIHNLESLRGRGDKN